LIVCGPSSFCPDSTKRLAEHVGILVKNDDSPVNSLSIHIQLY
jgi:hypothetical protein